jgi:hypothetical protein
MFDVLGTYGTMILSGLLCLAALFVWAFIAARYGVED